MPDFIKIKGARVHNLKNIDLTVPRDKLVVFTGLSGSGKSSLAFDTIYAEGHRRFVESLSSYARQFLGQLDKPDVDSIEGLSPAISIDQKTTSKNPRSTVGTVTEIYDYLRLLYARIGITHCPVCGKEISRQTVDQIIDKIMTLPDGERFMVLAPVVRAKKGMHGKVLADARKSGYTRVRIDGSMYDLDEEISLDKNLRHSIEVIVDRLVMRADIRSRLADSVETALALADKRLLVVTVPRDDGEKPREMEFSQTYACEEHGISFGDLEPRMFSFNNPAGACPDCAGLGVTRRISVERVIPDRSLSLAEGAISVNGFKSLEEESWNGPLFAAVAERYGFTLDTPIKDYTDKQLQVLLYGSGAEKYDVTRYFGNEGHRRLSTFDGIIPIIEQRMEYGGSADYYEQFIEEVPCATCHGIGTAGVDNKQYSEGIKGQKGGINAPTSYNSAFNFVQFWDGRAATLAEQAGGPPLNPVEMGCASFDEISARLAADADFAAKFKAVYPEGFNQATITDAIAEYEKTLITPNSPFDRYLKGDAQALTAEQVEGYALFKEYNCATCHAGVNMGGLSYELMGKRANYFQDREVNAKSGLTDADNGRWAQTKVERDRYRFKTPTLRNVALTWPYYHDGSVATLEEAVAMMARYQVGREMGQDEVKKVKSFLDALTGQYKGQTLTNTNKQ